MNDGGTVKLFTFSSQKEQNTPQWHLVEGGICQTDLSGVFELVCHGTVHPSLHDAKIRLHSFLRNSSSFNKIDTSYKLWS